MSNRKRILALVFCVGMLFVLFASSAYIAHEADHDCVGEECKICENIAQLEALVKTFSLMGVILLVLFALLAFFRALRAEDRLCAYHAPTLVSWKVRLNN